MSEPMQCGVRVVLDAGTRWCRYRDCPRPAYGYYMDYLGNVKPHCAVHFGAAIRREQREAKRQTDYERTRQEADVFRGKADSLKARYGIEGQRNYTYKGKPTNQLAVDIDRLRETLEAQETK